MVGLELGTNEVYEIVLWDGIVIVTILGDVDGLPLDTCDGTVLIYL